MPRLLLAVLLLAACDSPEAPPEPPDPPTVCAETGGALVGPACATGATRLRPLARIDGAWVGVDAVCTPEGDTIRCPTDRGVLVLEHRAEPDGERVTVSFEASADVIVEGLVADGPLVLEGATTWISNGFQSWSQTGALALGPLADDAALFEAIGARGDGEVLRTGRELSWEHTVVGGGTTSMLAGAIDSARFRPWIQVGLEGEAGAETLRLRLGSGGVERVHVAAGETVSGEPFRVAFGETESLLRAHAAALPARTSGAVAEAGWNSWYELWDGVDEEAVRANAARASALLGSRVSTATGGAPLRIVVDDGWQQKWGDWFPNDKFPSGLDGLASDLRGDGFRMGVWLAPLLAAEDSELATMHPDWLVGGATYDHAKNGTMGILDVTHPEVEAHLRETVARIVSWGYDLLKIDFLFAGTFEGTRAEDVTGMEAYHRALAILRDAAGDDVLLLLVGSPGLASLPYADSWRVGGDIALEPFGAAWPWIPNQARTLAARFALCLRVLCDADPPILRELPDGELETGAWVVALSGGALFLSDDLRTLADARVDLGLTDARVALALGGEPAYPEDFLPESPPGRLSNAVGDQLSRGGASTHVIPSVWRAPDGTRVAINASEAPITMEGVEVPPRGSRVLP